MNTTPDKLQADTSGSDFTADTFDIAPEDRALAAELMDFHPIRDVPSNASVVGSPRLPNKLPPLEGLPPEMRQRVSAQLASVPLAEREQKTEEFIRQALIDNSMMYRVRGGLGKGATPVQNEQADIAREVLELSQETARIHLQLAAVERWDNDIDPETGEPTPRAVERIRGQRRVAMENRLREIDHEIALKEGPEGQRRLAKALKESIEQRKAQDEQIAIEREAQELGTKMLRDERVQQRAESYAKHRRTTFG